MHKKYGWYSSLYIAVILNPEGTIVRVAHNQLSFSNVQAWKDIYGTSGKRQPFPKGPFYSSGRDRAPSLVTERDIPNHGRMRKLYSHAFSTKALQDQEELVQAHLHEFLQQLYKLGNTPKGLNMCRWFELLTFDVISDLTFGESFDSVKTGTPV
jgi:cytochrome P450